MYVKLIRLVPLILFITPPVLAGQQPLSIGTAAGMGMGGMTEARLSEAATWNPALAAIFDGPMSSMMALGVQFEPGDLHLARDMGHLGWRLGRDSLTTIDSRIRRTMMSWHTGKSLSRLRAEGAIQWLGVHSRDILISLASYGHIDYWADSHVLAVMAGDRDAALIGSAGETPPGVDGRASHRALTSVLSVAKGGDLGVLPVLGRTWAGVAVKAAVVHDHAIGRFSYTDPALVVLGPDGAPRDPLVRVMDGEVAGLYSEVGVQGPRILGLDVGAVINPAPAILVSVTLSNLVQKVLFDIVAENLYSRNIGFAGIDNKGNGRAFSGRTPLDVTAKHRPWFADAEFLAAGTHFTPTLRAGVSIDTNLGRFLGGGTLPLEYRYALDRGVLDEYSFGWQSISSPLVPRVSYVRRLDGSSGVLAGIQKGFCSNRLALGLGYVERSLQGRSLSMSIGWSRGHAPCGQLR